MKAFPDYLRLGNARGSVLRHRGDGQYYRDAGAWSVEAKRVKGKLVVHAPDAQDMMHHMHGAPFLAATEAEHKADNGEWAK